MDGDVHIKNPITYVMAVVRCFKDSSTSENYRVISYYNIKNEGRVK